MGVLVMVLLKIQFTIIYIQHKDKTKNNTNNSNNNNLIKIMHQFKMDKIWLQKFNQQVLLLLLPIFIILKIILIARIIKYLLMTT